MQDKMVMLWSEKRYYKEEFLKSTEFKNFTHRQVLDFLEGNPYGVDEKLLFDAVIGWARARYSEEIPSINENCDLEVFLAPLGSSNLLEQIRVPLFKGDQWTEMWNDKDSGVEEIPLSTKEKTWFDKYFCAPENDKQAMKTKGFKAFNFQARENECGISRVADQAWKHPVFLDFLAAKTAPLTNKFFTSPEFHGYDHEDVMQFLKTLVSGSHVNEMNIFYGILSWANRTCLRKKKPLNFANWQTIIAPDGLYKNSNLMGQIRIPLLSKEQWEEIWKMEEADLLPLTLRQKRLFDKYFALTSEADKQTMQNDELSTFNFRPRYLPLSVDSINGSPQCGQSNHVGNGQPEIPCCSRSISINSTAKQQSKTIQNLPNRNDSTSNFYSVPPPTKRPRRSGIDTVPANNVSTEDEFEDFQGTFPDYLQQVDSNTDKIKVNFKVDGQIEGLNMSEINNIIPNQYNNLKEYHLKFTFTEASPEVNDLDEKFREYVSKSLDLSQFMFYKDSDTGELLKLQKLWNSNINLSLEFHGYIVIKMDHARQELVLNTPVNSMEVVEGLKGVPLKRLVLGCSKFSPNLNFKEVETLILYGVKGTTEFQEILEKCESLVEVSLWKNELNAGQEEVDLSAIKNPEKLTWLSLCRMTIYAPIGLSFVNVSTLHLNFCDFSSDLKDEFTNIFPNVQKLSIAFQTVDIDVDFIVSILTLPRLVFVRALKVNYKGDRIGEFLRLVRAVYPSHNSFILEKKSAGNPEWEVTWLNDEEDPNKENPGGYHDTVDEQECEFYKHDAFCKKFSETVPLWKTYSHFGIPAVQIKQELK